MATLTPRRVVGVFSAILLTCVTVTGLSAAAQAEEGFQYWNYFHLDGEAWAFSDVGAAEYQPQDGDVEGFRYGTSTVSQGIEPRADLAEVDFDTVCGDSEAAAGEKRVAVLVDYGTEEAGGQPPEPRADCAVVDAKASTQQALGSVADVRTESGMTCGIDGYPAEGCGTPVKDAQFPANEQPVSFALPSSEADGEAASDAEARQETQDGTVPWPLVGVGALVLLLAAGALALRRRGTAA